MHTPLSSESYSWGVVLRYGAGTDYIHILMIGSYEADLATSDINSIRDPSYTAFSGTTQLPITPQLLPSALASFIGMDVLDGCWCRCKQRVGTGADGRKSVLVLVGMMAFS